MSIYSSLIPTAHVNHNVFDRSPRHVFSMKPAMLVPFYVKHTVPNSVYDINVMNTIEVAGMPKANFGRMSQNIDFFFVPYSQIWHLFDSMYYQRMDPVRNPDNVRNPTLPAKVPTFNYGVISRSLIEAFCYVRGYRTIIDNYNPAWNQPKETLISDFYDSYSASGAFSEFVDIHHRFCVDDMIRNFDLLGYGNLSPYADITFKLCVLSGLNVALNYSVSDVIDIFQGSASVSLNDLADYVNSKFSAAHDQLMELLDEELQTSTIFDILQTNLEFDASFTNGYGSCYYENVRNYKPSAFPILSYLKIFADYYRSVQYDNTNYAYFYNLDYIVNPAVNAIDSERIFTCLRPRYHLYKKDLFTGGYPNAQFGDVSVAIQDDKSFRLQAQNAGSTATNVGLNGATSGKMDLGRATTSSGTSFGVPLDFKMVPLLGISALTIRMAEAMQRWKEKNLRAGNRLSNQQSAMFGDHSRYIDDSYCRELGNTFSPIIIDDVVATADSANGLLVGEKGSKGSSGINNDVVKRFECHDFGCIIGIMYILPEADYDSFGFDPCNMNIAATDFPNPNFQNLGLEGVISSAFNLSAEQRVFTYLSRYWKYKADVSKVHGQFNSVNGAFLDYVSPRRVQQVIDASLDSLYCHPNDVDNLFYMSADELQTSDQFKVNMHVTGKDILPLSVEGLPY